MKTLERTLTIVKPDAVQRNAIGDIIEQFEKNGFRILCMKMLDISKHQAEQFYAVHAGRPFFNSLTDFMSSGPIVALALEKENAIADLRKLMGATNPANAEEGTIRKKWATSIENNAIHGSDADDTARFELSFFLAGYELTKSSSSETGAFHAISPSTMFSGCTADQKRKLAQRITDAMVEEAGARRRRSWWPSTKFRRRATPRAECSWRTRSSGARADSAKRLEQIAFDAVPDLGQILS